MRTVITGGCGFIGTALASRLLEGMHKSDEIILVDTMQRHGTPTDLDILSDPRLKIIEADLSDPDSFCAIPGKVDRIYHLAAIVGVNHVEADPVRVMQSNTLSTMYTLDWFIKNGTREARFLFSSSSEVYAGAAIAGFNLPLPTPENVPAVITDLGNPRFSYALTQMWGEAYANYLAEKYNVFTLSVRYHNIYGARMGYDHVIPQIISRVMARENPFKIIAAEQTRSFCWIDDAAKATHLLMESDKAEPGILVHVGNENGEIKIGKLYDLIFDDCSWWPEKVIRVPAPVGSVARRCPNTERLRLLTGYSPSTPLQEGLRETVSWYKENLQ